MKDDYLPKIDNDKIREMKVNSLNKIKKDNEVNDFINQNGLSDYLVMKNASKFLQYIEDKTICNSCPGFEKCNKMLKHISLELFYDDETKIIDNNFVNCKAATKIVECQKHFSKMDFDESWLNSSLKEALLVSKKERTKIICNLKGIIQSLKTKNNANGMFLYGNKSLGKSYILAAFCANVIENVFKNSDKTIAYVNCPKEFKLLQDLQFDSKEALKQEMQMLINADILILDDFGNEYKNDYLRDIIVLPILSERLSMKKLTLFTSNYNLYEIEDMYSTSRANGPKAKHLVNIISSLADEIKLEGLPIRF